MLEVCPSIADGKPSLEVHPLGIGGKADPARLVFDARPGPAVNTTLVDMGGRMRLIVAELDVVKPEHPMPKLPTARAVWIPRPDFKRGARPGSRLAARTTLPSARRSPPGNGRTSPGWRGSR